MITKAVVRSANGKKAVIEVERQAACDGCHKNKDGSGCSICSLTGANRQFSANAENKVGAKPGDSVEVETESKKVLLYSALVFLLPVAVGIGAYAVSGAFSLPETIRTVILVGGFFLTLSGVSLWSKLSANRREDIVITRILSASEGSTTNQTEG